MWLALVAMSLISSWTDHMPSLGTYQWKNRIVLIFAPSAADALLKKQCALIDANEAGFADRDMIVFRITERNPSAMTLRDHFHVAADAYVLVLIGKDGTEKFRAGKVVPADEVFKLVDSMPMRRAGGR